MAPDRGRNRAQDFEDLYDPAPNDFDPEADDIPPESDGSEAESGDEARVNGARDHYADVGKSKLRKPKTAALGPQYRGSKVSRHAMTDDEDEDDPFERGFEDEDSEVELDGSNGFANGHAHEESSESEDGGSGNDYSDVTSDAESRDGEEAKTARPRLGDENKKSKVLNAVYSERDVAPFSLAKSARSDAEKGRAVKGQRATFDSLLNTRIKLQKGLVGANTVVGTLEDDLQAQRRDAEDAIEAAENAAFSLWSSLNDFRDHLISTRTGEKRKRNYTISSPTAALWSHMQDQEEANLPHRNAALQRWSKKVHGELEPSASRGKVDKIKTQATILDSMREQLTDRERLLNRTRTPRSCAPLQLANKVETDERIYDDADFYGLLLKELLEQKSQDSVAASNIDLSFNLRREAKSKKQRDTKASKGRKLRYTVHEKLQNFMAPEDRSTWSERQTDDLFGSLFGQRLGLGEEREDDEEMDDGIAEEGARLMLFRS